tara:strand:- start:48 stop:788 length:741 start_codon:yes stop_codon:yes gene_type:complete
MFRYENDTSDKKVEVATPTFDSPNRRSLFYWSFACLVFTLYLAASLIIREPFTNFVDNRGINSDLLLLVSFTGAFVTFVKSTNIWLTSRPNEISPLDDLYLQFTDEKSSRRSVWMRVSLFVPLSLCCCLLLAWLIFSLPQTTVGLIIVGIFSVAIFIEGFAVVRDIVSQPIITEALVSRLWQKGRLLVFGQVYYLLIDKRLFEISAFAYHELQSHTKPYVRIRHWPHSNIVISVQSIQEPENAEAN